MGLFGALFTGVSALSAQSQATSIISNNIANINTTGFRRSEAAFASLVTTESPNAAFSPGTVTANRIQRVDEQGPITQSASGTDVSITGNGFFAVRSSPEDNSSDPFLFTRNGQFSENAQGFLTNSAGFFLYGFPVDVSGELPPDQGDLDSLVPINVGFSSGLTLPTNNAELALNVDSREPQTLLSDLGSTQIDFSRGLTVFDSLGNAQNLDLEFTRTFGPFATSVSTRGQLSATDEVVNDLGLTAGDQFTISADGGPPRTYIISNTENAAPPAGVDASIFSVADLLNDIEDNVPNVDAFVGENGEIVIQHENFLAGTESFTLTDTVGNALSSFGILAGTFVSDNLSSGQFDNGTTTDSPPFSSGTFPTFQFLDGDPLFNRRGFVNLTVRDPNGNVLSDGLLNFNGDGSINALPDIDGNIDIELNQIDFDNGSELQNISIDVDQFTQFASEFSVSFSDQDGAELGLRTGLEITANGEVVAQFSNGATAALFQVPLVTFSNPNGLLEVSGTAYVETEGSGEENINIVGTGGAGFIQPGTLENSNVDLADEFALLIISQRAFSANTRVINTVDELTQELLSLR